MKITLSMDVELEDGKKVAQLSYWQKCGSFDELVTTEQMVAQGVFNVLKEIGDNAKSK